MEIQIGEIIRKYRIKLHLTQEELAEKIDKSSGYIGQVERNETTPSLDALIVLMNVLNIDASTIFCSKENETNELLVNELCLRISKLSKEKQELPSAIPKSSQAKSLT